jgi:hypothetical protein
MRNVTPLVTPDEIRGYVYDLWKTDEFRANHDRKGMVFDFVDRFSRVPRLFADMSDAVLETPHFSSWWNVIARRDTYAKPAIHDLYYLHEIIHAATIAHVPEISFESFQQKMTANELDTSVATEILVYFEIPDLRDQAFEHEIYADRFLADLSFRRFWEDDREGATAYLRESRRDVMFGKRPETLDPIEAAIHLYASQNTQWQMVWKIRYGEVEQAMGEFERMARERDRAAALEHLLARLGDPRHTRGTDVPFRLEAESFASIYWNNKAHYQEMIASLAHQGLRPVTAAGSVPAG